MKILKFAAAAVLGAATSAGAATLDFEEFTAGTIPGANPSTFVKDGVTITISATRTGKSSGNAMVFDSANPTGNDVDLAAPFYETFLGGPMPGGGNPDLNGNTLSPGKILIISQDNNSGNPNDNANGGTITFSFSKAVTFFGFDVFDDVDAFQATANTDASSTPISLDYDRQFASVRDLNWEGVTSVTFDFGRASGAIDNISFAPVPVPASLPLLLAGMGAFAFLRHRR